MINIDEIKYHQTNTWSSYKELCQEPNTVIAKFITKIYNDGVFKEINRLLTSKEYPKCEGIGHIVLISICSAIDSLSAYASGGGRVGNRFTTFITKYFSANYIGKESKIYEVFRCDGVHGWNLHRSCISGEVNDKYHLSCREDILYISLYDFYSGLIQAFNKYCEELKSSDELKNNLLKRYKEIRVKVDKVKENIYIG